MTASTIRTMQEFTTVCNVLSRKVQAIALVTLQQHGYYGIECSIDAPNDFPSLLEAYGQGGKLFPVYSEGNDQTIYSSPVINMLARAWHDLKHVEFAAEFTLDGEMLVSLSQAYAIGDDGAYIFNTLEREILTLEVVAQVEFNIEFGQFPINQKQFILDCLNYGKIHAFDIHFPLLPVLLAA